MSSVVLHHPGWVAGKALLTAAPAVRIYGSYIHKLSIEPMPADRRAPDDFLPLKTDAFYVLLVLLHGERHGYAIMREAAERSEGRVELQAGALYRLLHRMLDEGLVVESQRRPAADSDDERRRYYRVTALGRRIIAAEAERMAALASAARAALAGERGLA